MLRYTVEDSETVHEAGFLGRDDFLFKFQGGSSHFKAGTFKVLTDKAMYVFEKTQNPKYPDIFYGVLRSEVALDSFRITGHSESLQNDPAMNAGFEFPSGDPT